MKQEVIRIHVRCTDCFRVEGANSVQSMVLFGGIADHPNFRGSILPGGCDTQTQAGNTVRLSARYALEGIDCAGENCRIFIENNGAMTLPQEDLTIHTVPKVTTDSAALAWLETANLTGTVSPEGENRVLIRIFAEETI